MTRYSLDTNICIGFTKGDVLVESRMAELDPAQISICSVVRAELFFGAANSGRPEANFDLYRSFASSFGTLGFDDIAAEIYGRIRSDLKRSGKPIGGNDLMIAAIALANDCILVTRNHREFLRVPGLRVETW
jgi:tRNA(fMet)-specific endonuclease VapC